MNEQIVLISTFCDTDDKIKILLNNIKKIKNEGFDVAIISPLILPNEIIDISELCFFYKRKSNTRLASTFNVWVENIKF